MQQDLFTRLYEALSILEEPPSEELLADPRAIALGAVLPVWREMPHAVVVATRMCGPKGGQAVLCAMQYAHIGCPWYPDLRAILRYSQSVKVLGLLRSLSAEHADLIELFAKSAQDEDDLREKLDGVDSGWAILAGAYQEISSAGVKRVICILQRDLDVTSKQLPDIIKRLTDE